MNIWKALGRMLHWSHRSWVKQKPHIYITGFLIKYIIKKNRFIPIRRLKQRGIFLFLPLGGSRGRRFIYPITDEDKDHACCSLYLLYCKFPRMLLLKEFVRYSYKQSCGTRKCPANCLFVLFHLTLGQQTRPPSCLNIKLCFHLNGLILLPEHFEQGGRLLPTSTHPTSCILTHTHTHAHRPFPLLL